VPVEVGGGGTDGDEADVHVDAVADADDVAQQPPVLIDAIGHRLGQQPHPCAGQKQRLRPRRSSSVVALRAEEDLRCVDLDEADALAVSKDDGSPSLAWSMR
jgi:hypothetical protein